MEDHLEEIDEARYKEEISKNEYTVIYFGAEVWSHDWRRLRVFVDEIANSYPNVKFFKMSYEKNLKLYEELGLNTIPTTLFYKNGREAHARYAGGNDRPDWFIGAVELMMKSRF